MDILISRLSIQKNRSLRINYIEQIDFAGDFFKTKLSALHKFCSIKCTEWKHAINTNYLYTLTSYPVVSGEYERISHKERPPLSFFFARKPLHRKNGREQRERSVLKDNGKPMKAVQ